MSYLTVNIHQVGFIPLYTPFYMAVKNLAKKLGWDVRYYVGVSDEDNIKRACRFKFRDKNNIHIVLTSLHNLRVVKDEVQDKTRQTKRVCKDCEHMVENKCSGAFEDVEWSFPWIFVVKLPVYVFLKGDVEDEKLKTEIENIGVGRQFTWEGIKKLFKSEKGVKRIYIYPEGATINEAVLNHIFKTEKNELEVIYIDFDIEEKRKEEYIDKDEEPLLVFTLNPHLYEGDESYKLIMKPSHHFFPFTGVALPVISDKGVTIQEMKFLYYLEEEYINFMTQIQENYSPFFEKKEKDKNIESMKKELEDFLKNDINRNGYRFYKEGNYTENYEERKLDESKINTFWRNFEKLYNDGVFREHTENVIKDYLKEKTDTAVVLFDPEIYKARVKDAAAYIFARNLSHVYGSNVIPYVVNDISSIDIDDIDSENLNYFKGIFQEFKKSLQNFLKFLQERMDYIATIISDEHISRYAFIDFDLRNLYSIFRGYDNEPFNYLYTSLKDNTYLEIPDKEINKPITASVPPVAYKQAFCSIFENILRNSAKYGKYEDVLALNIKVEEVNKSSGKFIKISIVDKNVDKTKKKNIVDELNKRLKKSVVRPYLDISYESWGLKEIKISAAYLRGIPMERIDLEDEEEFPIVSVEETSEGIAFVFYLYPFKRVLSIEDLNDLNKDIPCEFLIIKDKSREIKDTVEKRKYTRVFTEEVDKGTSQRKEDWNLLADKWKKELSGNRKIEEYFLSDPSAYEKFSYELKERLDEIDNNKIIVAYVRHLKNIGEEKLYDFLQKIKEKSPYSYIQSIRGGGFIYSLLEKAQNDEFVRYKLIESALLRILILDERVQEKIKNYSDVEVKSCNIYVPQTPLSRGGKSAVKDGEAFSKLCKELEYIKNTYNPHLVVVHVSLLEQADEHLGKEVFSEKLEEIFNGSDIILTTGRGKVTSAYRDKYGDAVPVSHIINALESKDFINKYTLSNILIGFNRNLLFNRNLKKEV